jgi:hypothetical protein
MSSFSKACLLALSILFLSSSVFAEVRDSSLSGMASTDVEEEDVVDGFPDQRVWKEHR